MFCPLTEADGVQIITRKWSWFKLLQKDIAANILATPIMLSEKRKTGQKTWNMVVGLRIATDWQVNFVLLCFSRIQWSAF